MKKISLIIYLLFSWLIISVMVLSGLLLFVVESPSTVLSLVQTPLKEQGIHYGEMKGDFFSGFILKDVNYQEKLKAKELRLKVDFKQLKKRILYIENVVVDNVEVEQDFLASLIDSNATEEENQSREPVDLPFDQVVVKRADISLQNTTYQAYHVRHAQLHIDNLNSDMKEKHEGRITFSLESNMTELDLDATFKNDAYQLHTTIEGEKAFLAPFIAEENVTLLSNPKLTIEVEGDLKALEYKLTTHRLELQQNEYRVSTKVLNAFGHYDIEKRDVESTLKMQLDANVAKLTLDAHATLNLDDLNNTLRFNSDITFEPKEHLVKSALKEQNITIDRLPLITMMAKGSMKKIDFLTHLNGLKAKQNGLSLDVSQLDINGTTNVLHGKSKVIASTHFNSSVADGKVDLKSTLNFKDLNRSLLFESRVKLNAHDAYINPFLEETEARLQGEIPIMVEANGSMERLTVRVNAGSTLIKEDVLSEATLQSEPIVVDLKTHQVKGALRLHSDAKNMDLALTTQFRGDYTHMDKLETKTRVDVNQFNAFGINLTSLTPLMLNAKSDSHGVWLTLDSKKIDMRVQSRDYDHIRFDIKTGNIYPYKIVEVPEALKNKFMKLDLKGDATRSKSYFSLKGLVESNKQFTVDIDAHNSNQGLDVDLHTQHLKLQAKGDLEDKNIDMKVNIDSLTKVQEEFMLLYPFTSAPVDGALSLNAELKGEQVWITVDAPKLKLDDFNVEALRVDGEYKHELLTLNTLKFKTTGFKDKRLNRAFYLNQKGKIHLGERRDIFLDMHPKILIKAQGTVENLKGDFTIEALPLGYPTYGSALLSTQVHYEQLGQKRKIVGGISLEKLKLFYEAKFLDVANDADVVVITKKDKEKRKESDSFLEDTYIDLAIYAPDAVYKTQDIDLTLTLDVKAKKAFGKYLGVLGKVQEINGRVEQAPKLFTVVDSNIVFRGMKEVNPLLDIEVEYALPDVLITIKINGDANRPKLTFSSDPIMPKKDILSYLLFGVSTASLAEGEGSLEREAELFIMNQVARDFAYEVGLDRIFIKDDGTGEGYAVQVGKKVKEDAMFIIENSEEGNSYILEYDVTKDIKVEVGQHQKAVPSQSIDIFFRKKFK